RDRCGSPPPPYTSLFRSVADTLSELAGPLAAQNVLEAGCGTGRWLADLAAPGRALYGLDASRGMLHGAAQRGGRLNLVHGRAESDRKSTRLNSSHVKISY